MLFIFQIAQVIYMTISVVYDLFLWRTWFRNSKINTNNILCSLRDYFGSTCAFPLAVVCSMNLLVVIM